MSMLDLSTGKGLTLTATTLLKFLKRWAFSASIRTRGSVGAKTTRFGSVAPYVSTEYCYTRCRFTDKTS